jgi:hypothetical protein
MINAKITKLNRSLLSDRVSASTPNGAVLTHVDPRCGHSREHSFFLLTGNHHNNNKTQYNNCSSDKQSNSYLIQTTKPTTNNTMVRPPIITPSAIWAISCHGDLGHRFDLRFRAAFSIK